MFARMFYACMLVMGKGTFVSLHAGEKDWIIIRLQYGGTLYIKLNTHLICVTVYQNLQ